MKEGLGLSLGCCPQLLGDEEKNLSLEVGGNQLSEVAPGYWGRTNGQEKAESRAEEKPSIVRAKDGGEEKRSRSCWESKAVRHSTVREAHKFKESDFLGSSGGGKFREIAGMILSDTAHLQCPRCPVLSDPCSNSAGRVVVSFCFMWELISVEIKQCSESGKLIHDSIGIQTQVCLTSSGWGKWKLKWVWDSLSSLETYSGPCFCLRSLENFIMNEGSGVAFLLHVSIATDRPFIWVSWISVSTVEE